MLKMTTAKGEISWDGLRRLTRIERMNFQKIYREFDREPVKAAWQGFHRLRPVSETTPESAY